MLKKINQTVSQKSFLESAQNILDVPLDRINISLRDKLTDSNKKFLVDVHAHSFNLDYVPKDFEKLISWLSFEAREKVLNFFFKKLGRYMGIDQPKNIMDKLVDFYCKYFDKINYTHELLIVNLMMDMERGIGGGAKYTFEHQIEDLLHFLTQSHPTNNYGEFQYSNTIIPFLALDPHNPNLFKQFLSGFVKNINHTNIEYLDNNAPFLGVKMYPVLGYMPYDPILMDIFEICEDKNIPITTHCGGYRTRTSHVKIELGSFTLDANGNRIPKYKWHTIKSKKNLKETFLDPLHWEKVLKQFPDLKLNLAHLGDDEEWDKYRANDQTSFINKALKLIDKYENVYGDISYSFHDEKTRKDILNIMKNNKYEDRVLYGSDFYLAEITKSKTINSLVDLHKKFINYPQLWDKLIGTNPLRFLFEL